MAIIDLDANPIKDVGFIPGSSSIWHDAKTYQNYAYTVADQGNQGLQIIDLANLPTSVSLTKTWYGDAMADVSQVHNIQIDTLRGILYLTDQGTQGVNLIDIKTDPLNPVTLSVIPGEGHDMCINPEGNLLVIATGRSSSLGFWDVTDIANPSLLYTQSVGSGYSHSCSFHDDNVHLATAIETIGEDIRFWDASPVWDNNQPILLDTWISDPGIIGTNIYYEGDVLYVPHNTAGIWILDVRDHTDVKVLAHHDPSTSTGTFDGTWGVYPWLPSGKVIHLDGERGLFVVTPDPEIVPINGYFTQDSTPPTNASYSQGLTHVYVVGTTIPVNNFSYTGSQPTTLSISPALPAGLQFNISNGSISGTATEDSPATDYQVVVTNTYGSDTLTLNIEVIYLPPTSLAYSRGLLMSQTIDVAIVANNLSYSGSPATSITVSPTLPQGLSLSATGTVSGTPSTLSSLTEYTVTVTNQAGTSNLVLIIEVKIAPIANVQYTGGTIYDYTVNTLIAPNIIIYEGTADSIYVSTPLPEGLEINSEGTISGTPTEISSPEFYTIYVENSEGIDSVTLQIEIKPEAPANVEFSEGAILKYAIGEPITENEITYQGSPHTAITISPELPLGLVVNAEGIISGIPTQASPATNYVVTVSNESGEALAIITIEVFQPVNIAEQNIPLHYNLTSISPNPFATRTSISFEVPGNSSQNSVFVTIEVFNLQGIKMKTLIHRDFTPGYKNIVFDGSDEKGFKLKEGVYLLKMTAADFNKTLKMSIIR